ncbi:hypothetical protein FV141_08145 [Dermacoccus abyssi]|uniref:DUF4352 domain-containing protein n=1 Tax=Dermacoccus abyssi TaxID=322596 RepID=A0ABX5Z9Q7_9MICO|nr:hypothetical protein FV141_08145 [Dermacoccus abyssi]
MNRRLALAAAPLLLLAACSSGEGSSDPAPSSSSSSSPSERSQASSEQTEASVEEVETVPLGTEARVDKDGSPAYTINVTEFDPKIPVPYDDQAFLGLKAGHHWSRAKAKVCPTELSNVNWYMFFAIDTDGGTYPGIDQSFHDPFPGPLLPDLSDGIPKGPCRTGWVYIPVLDGAKVKTINYQDGGAAVDWAVE